MIALLAHVGMGLTAMTAPHTVHTAEAVAPPAITIVANPALNGVNCQDQGCYGPNDYIWIRDGKFCFQAPLGADPVNGAFVDPTCGVKA